ncbi:MAG: hypothetical protein NC336_01670 [Clostridium sp.]|nr:hypothetical protein [Clostridium sp.]
MTPENNFSADRYLGELRRTAMSKPSVTLMYALAVFITLLLVSLTIERTFMEMNLRTWEEYDSYQDQTASMTHILQSYVIFYILFSAIAASLMFNGLRSRQSRVATLTRPVTAGEMFLAEMTVYVAGFIAVYILSILLSDIVRLMVINLLTFAHETHYESVITYTFREVEHPVPFLITIFITGLFTGSLYAVGAVIWPSNSFLKCSAALFAAAVGVWIYAALLGTLTSGVFDPFGDNVGTVARYAITSALLLLLTALNWTIALTRLKEFDLK